NAVPIGEVHVHFVVGVVVVEAHRHRPQVVILQVAVAYAGQKRLEVIRDRRNAAGRDHSSRKHAARHHATGACSGERVVYVHGQRAEVAAPLGQRGNGHEAGSGLDAMAVSVVGAEEEDLILADGSANVEAKLVLVFFGSHGGEEA